MSDESLLVRFREKDSREGITRATMKKIASALDLSETAALHRALVEYAQRFVPQYPRDNGPLSEAQYRKVAGLYHRLAWLARAAGNAEREKACLTTARAGYQSALDNNQAVGTSFSKIVGICAFSFDNAKLWPRSAS